MNPLPIHPVEGVLAKIVAQKLQSLEIRQHHRPIHHLSTTPSIGARSFYGALSSSSLALIAEYKPKSPSSKAVFPQTDPTRIAKVYSQYAQAISVLCDTPFFGGHLKLLTLVRMRTHCPVLCKDFILSRYQLFEAREAGADAVLLMASLLPQSSLKHLLSLTHALGMDALVEVHNAIQLEEAIGAGAKIIGVNSRDLISLQVDLNRGVELLQHIPPGILRVAESGLRTARDVERVRPMCDATLIGSALMESSNQAHTIESLGWRQCA